MQVVETRKRAFGENGVYNTSPHDMHVFSKDGSVLTVYEKATKMVRCDQAKGEVMPDFDEAEVLEVTPYTLNLDDLKEYKEKGVKVLLCSTLLANHHEEIKKELGEYVRCLVPDSGASAQRNPDGSMFVRRWFEYGAKKKVNPEDENCRRSAFIDKWVAENLRFIEENVDPFTKGFVTGTVLQGTADECLARMKVFGWKFTPDLVYDPSTTHIHLVPVDFKSS